MEERLHALAEKGIYIKPDVKIENSEPRV